jgi:mRNA-degrading endonuclease HigB of HigAB toxin-antitoxin module
MTRLQNYITEAKVGQTILKQIKALDKWALPSYGAKNFVESDKGIQFDVKGSKFRGKVIISLDKGSDSYVIEFGQVRKLEWKSKLMLKSIFAAELVNVLDQQIG